MSEEQVLDPKKALLVELKKAGLDIAEDAVGQVVKAVIKILPAYLLSTENKMDDILISILPVIEPFILKAVDKIDGEVDIVE